MKKKPVSKKGLRKKPPTKSKRRVPEGNLDDISLISDSGRLDAKKISVVFDLSIKRLASIIGHPYSMVKMTPDSPTLQESLRPFSDIAALLLVFSTPTVFKAWFKDSLQNS